MLCMIIVVMKILDDDEADCAVIGDDISIFCFLIKFGSIVRAR